MPLIAAGDDLADVIVRALAATKLSLHPRDVLILAQKIVSKAEDRSVALKTVTPSPRAIELAQATQKDPRVVELILSDSNKVIRQRPGAIIVVHRLGYVLAKPASTSRMSNTAAENGERALLLPVIPTNPAATCARGCLSAPASMSAHDHHDSHRTRLPQWHRGYRDRRWSFPALTDLRGEADLYGRTLRSTEVALADEIAAAASLLMGQAAESRPIVLAHGVPMQLRDGSAAELIRPKHMDLFRQPSGDAVIRGRRSVRRYTDDVIAEALLERLLSAAVCAPSAHNRQPWRFAIVQDANRKAHLATAMGAQLRADRQRDGDATEAIEQDVARSIARITSAPTLVLTCLTMEEMDRYPDPRRNEAERTMAVQGTAMATQNLLLAAHAARSCCERDVRAVVLP